MEMLVPAVPVTSKLFKVDETGSEADLHGLTRQVFRKITAQGSGRLTTGVASVTQMSYLMHLARWAEASLVVEVGFNIGFSAMAFLESSPETRVVSFEIDTGPAIHAAKEFVDARYPGRHELVFGDSATSVVEYADRAVHGGGADLIFLDGGHEYEMIAADIRNSRRLAGDNTLIVVDDLTPWYPWGTGPMSAWTEAVRSGVITPLEYQCDGVPKDAIEGPADRAWGVGRLAMSESGS